MQRCGSSHGNMMRPCPCNGPFHTQPNSFSMLLSVPLDQINVEPSPTAVDCTLSLGTPSTRRDAEKRITNRTSVTDFRWDFLHAPTNFPQSGYKIGRESFNGVDGVDPLLARRCANCDTTSTPLWRNGPRGPKSLCNACGIRFKKEERRAAGAEVVATDSQRAWVPLSQTQKDSGAGVPFLSWRLNVTDRPSLVHEFTR